MIVFYLEKHYRAPPTVIPKYLNILFGFKEAALSPGQFGEIVGMPEDKRVPTELHKGQHTGTHNKWVACEGTERKAKKVAHNLYRPARRKIQRTIVQGCTRGWSLRSGYTDVRRSTQDAEWFVNEVIKPLLDILPDEIIDKVLRGNMDYYEFKRFVEENIPELNEEIKKKITHPATVRIFWWLSKYWDAHRPLFESVKSLLEARGINVEEYMRRPTQVPSRRLQEVAKELKPLEVRFMEISKLKSKEVLVPVIRSVGELKELLKKYREDLDKRGQKMF